MTQEEIEDTKEILTFMGYKHTNDDPKTFPNGYYYKESDEGERGISSWELPTQCLYHEDWNWLMQVIEKIESEKEHPVRFNITRTQIQVSIYAFGGMSIPDKNLSFVVNAETKILAAFNAIIEYIKRKKERYEQHK